MRRQGLVRSLRRAPRRGTRRAAPPRPSTPLQLQPVRARPPRGRGGRGSRGLEAPPSARLAPGSFLPVGLPGALAWGPWASHFGQPDPGRLLASWWRPPRKSSSRRQGKAGESPRRPRWAAFPSWLESHMGIYSHFLSTVSGKRHSYSPASSDNY